MSANRARRWLSLACGAACLVALLAVRWNAAPVAAQDHSVKPGINKPYENPDLNDMVKRFEGESREIFQRRKELTAACRLRPGMKVADIGAGTGLFTRLFSPLVGASGKVYAVDITPKFIEHIEKSCREAGMENVVGVLCTDTALPLEPNSIDLAFVCDTYHHFEYPFHMLAAIRRALRPGGQLIVVDFKKEPGKTLAWIMEHVRADQAAVRDEIRSAGFTFRDEINSMHEQYLLRFEKPVEVIVEGCQEPAACCGK